MENICLKGEHAPTGERISDIAEIASEYPWFGEYFSKRNKLPGKKLAMKGISDDGKIAAEYPRREIFLAEE